MNIPVLQMWELAQRNRVTFPIHTLGMCWSQNCNLDLFFFFFLNKIQTPKGCDKAHGILESTKYFHILVHDEAPHHPCETGRVRIVVPVAYMRNQSSEVRGSLM